MVANYTRMLRMFNRDMRLYLLATGLLGFALDGGVYPVVFNLYLLRLGFGPEAIGQINSVALLAFALFSLPAGALGHWLGVRRMMIAGLLFMIGGGFALPVAELLPRAWLGAGITAAFVASYLGLAFYFVNAVPFVVEITTPVERQHAFSMQSALLALAAFSGALVGGLLPRLFATVMGMAQQQPAPYRFPLVSATALLLVALWAILLTRPTAEADGDAAVEEAMMVSSDSPPRPPNQRRMETAMVVTILLLSAVRFFQVAGVATTGTFFNVYLDTELGVATAQIGLLSALARLVGVPAALITPVLTARWSAPRTVVWASLGTTLGLLPLALLPTWGAAGLGLVGVMAFSSMRYPAYLVFAMDLVPARWRATLSGAGEMAGGLCFASMALVGGYIIAAQGFRPLFLFAALLTLIGTVLFYLWFVAPWAKKMVAPVAGD
jgi:MFS family permease